MTILELSIHGGAMILLTALFRAAAIRRVPKRVFPTLWGLVCIRLLVPWGIGLPVLVEAAPFQSAGGLPVGVPAQGGGTAGPSLLPALWAAVALVVALWFVSTHLYFCGKYRAAVPVRDAATAAWLRDHPLRRRVRVKSSPSIPSPLTYGILHPVILVPEELLGDEERLPLALAHELAHIRRWDVARKWLLVLAVSIHWFDPLVWLMYVLANRDMELACDEAAASPMRPKERAAYLMFLLDLAEKQVKVSPVGNAFGKNVVEERVNAVMKMKKTTARGVLAAVLAVVLLTAAGVFTLESRAADREEVVAPQLITPTAEWVRENGYPKNERGETYGPEIRENNTPDLTLAVNNEGVTGYVRESEIRGSDVSTPEEAMEYMENRSPEGMWVNMYLQDGVTVIGKLFIKSS